MSHYIELHITQSSKREPMMVNTDWIEYITPLKEGSLIRPGTVSVDGNQNGVSSRSFMLHVDEDYYTIKEMLHCQ